MEKILRCRKNVFVLCILALNSIFSYAQVPTCDANVPFYKVNLTGKPEGSWVSPVHARNGKCCGVTGVELCTSFEVILDPAAVAIKLEIASGAMPSGAMYYQISCGTPVPVGQELCLSGIGPHRITFCKPGNNNNTYRITSVSKPVFPPDTTVRIGCAKQLPVLGVKSETVTWNSVFPGASGQYNSYLSCTDCASPSFSPAEGAPNYVDYVVCGMPFADFCGYTIQQCDTVRVYINDRLTGNVNPSPASFCNNGPGSGVNLTASGSGGNGSYSYIWRNSSSTVVGNSSSYFANAQGNYSVEIRDGLYNASSCPGEILNVPVSVAQMPVVNAGDDQSVCAINPRAFLNGSVENASGGTWSGGNGTFDPNPNTLTATYYPTPAEVSAGHVYLTLTSNNTNGCPQVQDVMRISFPTPVQATIQKTEIPCYGGSSSLTTYASGGIPPYSYSWNTGAKIPDITVPSGTYCVTVTDALGCPVTTCTNVVAPDPLSLNTSSTNVTSNGGNDGSASAVTSGGTVPYSYLWSNNETTSTISNLTYGVYTVYVTDANGCTINGSVVVNEPSCSDFDVQVSGTDLNCYADADATATAIASGGNPPYSYMWDNGQNNSVATGLAAGTYTIFVNDEGGCVSSKSVTISSPTPVLNTFTYGNVTNITQDNGWITANPSGGSPGYTYLWNNGQTSQTINNLNPGFYKVTVTDSKGCQRMDSIVIAKDSCNNLVANVIKTDNPCYGQSLGSANVLINSGASPYQYEWSNGTSDATVSGLSAGNYSVIVTDATACYKIINFTITHPDQLSLGLAPTNVNCHNAANGTIETTISGGVFPYSFNWSNGSGNEDLINLTPGSYSLTATDANGCQVSGSADISQPAVLELSSVETNPKCFGGNDGAIDLSVTGGVQPYSFAWSNGATTEDILNVGAGNYTITVTDANGCVKSNQNILVTPDSLRAIVSSAQGSGGFQIKCNGQSSGSATVTAEGGVADYTYLWSGPNGFTSDLTNIDSLRAGTYNVLITDAHGCTATNSIVLTQPDTFNVHFVSPVVHGGYNITCHNAATGNLSVNPSGGDSTSYVYSWTGPDGFTSDQRTISDLKAGEYHVTVSDGNGCPVSNTFMLTQPDPLNVNFNSSVHSGGFNISCFGMTGGTLGAQVSGGDTASYVFAWTGPNGFTSDQRQISNLAAGVYHISVTDANGCSVSNSFTMTQPDSMKVSFSSPEVSGGYHITCNGEKNGNLSVVMTGGDSTSYVFNWTGPNGFTSEQRTLSGLEAGAYHVVVTDANGCSVENQFVLTQPDTIKISFNSTEFSGGFNISCNGESTGSLSASVTGGDATSYNFNWSGPDGFTSNENFISGLKAGQYMLTVTDANGCTLSNNYTLTQPDSININFNATVFSGNHNITCNGANTGELAVEVSGGDTASLVFNWSGPNGFSSSNRNINNLSAGEYNLTVTDANGCTKQAAFVLTQPDSLKIEGLASSHNGSAVSCFGAADGSVTLNISGGDPSTYFYSWNGDNGFISEAKDVNGLMAGNYNVVVSDSNGCVASASFVITQPDALVASASASSNYNGFSITCHGGSDGQVQVNANGGTKDYSYTWDNGQSGNNVTGLAAGIYYITVTDKNGCTTIASVELIEPEAVVVSSNINHVPCNGFFTGVIATQVSGGAGGYTYMWNNGDTNAQINNLGAGNYNVIVRDANNCQVIHEATVLEESPLVVSVSSKNETCYESNNGQASVQVEGGVAPYVFSWSNGVQNAEVNNLEAGEYTVIVTDNNECFTVATVHISQPDSLVAELNSPITQSGYHVSFFKGNDGMIEAHVTGGTGPYMYTWNNGASINNLLNVMAGEYNLIVKDTNGCETRAKILLSEPDALAMPTGISPNGDGLNDFFVVRGLEAYPNNRLVVVNRWGSTVFRSEPYKNDWYGVNTSGESLPDGTYFVVLTVNGGEITLTGYVDVRRNR
ncbi:MAG: gliding motility-associated C-terminal domain-containing protein [Cytophagaceae bacterium]